MKTLRAALLLLAFSQAPLALAQAMDREACEAMKKKIDQLEELRRKGGSASEMDAWKRELRKYETSYLKARCKKYGKAFW